MKTLLKLFCSGQRAGIPLLMAALVFAGCGKAKKPVAASVPETAASAEPNNAPAPVAQASLAAAPLATPTGETDMAELNRTMLRWILGHRRVPANFEEFAATAGVAIPPPPAGKKYVIGRDKRIQLVNK